MTGFTAFYFTDKERNDNFFFKKLLRKTLAVPIVDGIDWNTIAHKDIYSGRLKRGIWEWGFLYKEANVPDKELSKRKRSEEPYW